MTSKKLTTSPTESDLESAIDGVIMRVFHWLPRDAVHHQTKFSFKVGRGTVHIDGTKGYVTEGRADIILSHMGRPLAVLELKRNGVQLTDDDASQGLSYARMLVPSPPLVILTNGDDTRLFETHTGTTWNPSGYTEEALAQLARNAAQVAKADLRQAVDTLMGTNARVWRQALKQVTSDAFEELRGDWDSSLRPFVPDFLIPRHATVQTLKQIVAGERLVLVEGAPMAGKSNVLRELATHLFENERFGVLYVEAGVGRDIFGRIADALADALDWPVAPGEARDWLIRVSKAASTKLVLLVDSFLADSEGSRKDIEDLSSPRFGGGLAVVAALDDSVADMVVLSGGGRGQSAIGRRASRVRVDPLSGREFEAAASILANKRVSFMRGAQMTPEYRQPWVLRSVAAAALQEIEGVEVRYGLALPPFQGMDLIRHARSRFNDPGQRRLFTCLANAVLAEINDETRRPELVLQSVALFVIRDATVAKYIGDDDRAKLISSGLIKPAVLADKSTGLVVQLPEMLASELARLLEDELIRKARAAPDDAAHWLSKIASSLPFGDVITARSAFDAAQQAQGLNSQFIEALLDSPPISQPPPAPGSKFSLMMPGGLVTITMTSKGPVATAADGQQHKIEITEGDGFGSLYDNIYPWLILSHLTELPFILESSSGKVRVDMHILLEVGSAPMVLRKMDGTSEMQMFPAYDGPDSSTYVACEAGIIEPITFSIFQMFLREEDEVDDWIEAAITQQSLPLLHRIHIALNQATQMAQGHVGMRAKQILADKIGPELQRMLQK